MNHDIFISYSSKQKSVADGVCHYLEENGFKCWMAPRDIPVGSDYGDLIVEAIMACKVVVLVFSEAASISNWVQGEINVAFDEHKAILPFRVEETEIKGAFRLMLNQIHWVDAFPRYADRLPELLDSVCGLLGRPPRSLVVQEEHKVYVCYSRKDMEQARTFCDQMDKMGVSYWADFEGKYCGDTYKAVLVEAIKSSQLLLFLSSKHSNKSEYVLKEVSLALFNDISVLPIRLDNTPYADAIAYDLSGYGLKESGLPICLPEIDCSVNWQKGYEDFVASIVKLFGDEVDLKAEQEHAETE